MKEIKIITGAEQETFYSLSLKVAIKEGFNCYAKPVAYKDTANKFYFSWKPGLLQVTIEHQKGAPIYTVSGFENKPEVIEIKQEPGKNFIVDENEKLVKILEWFNENNVPVSHRPVGSKYKIMVRTASKEIEKQIRTLIQN